MAKRLNATYLHLSYRWPDHMFEYHTAAIRWAIRKSHKQPVIIDRWWPSEALYAAEYRKGSRWPQMGRMMDRIARKHGAVYVYCLPDDMVEYKKRFDKLKTERSEMYDSVTGVATRYLSLWHGYKEHPDTENYADMLTRTGGVQNRADHVKYTIETWGNKLDLFTDYVAQRADSLYKSQLPDSMDHPNFLGHIAEAQYLMVGERVNPKYNNLEWPWYDYGNSSLFLAEALHVIPAHENLFVWANAINHDGSRNKLIERACEYKPELKAVAVGKVALTHLNKAGIEVHEHVRHPAFVRRFGTYIFDDHGKPEKIIVDRKDSVNYLRGVFRHAIN